MPDPEFWKAAKARGGSAKTPGPSLTEAEKNQTIWTLTKGAHIITAELWRVPGIDGMDLRYMYDGEMRQTELFRGPMGGAYTVEKSVTKRDELKEDGWREPA